MHGTRRNGRRDLDSKASYEYEGNSGSLNLNKEIGTGQRRFRKAAKPVNRDRDIYLKKAFYININKC